MRLASEFFTRNISALNLPWLHQLLIGVHMTHTVSLIYE